MKNAVFVFLLISTCVSCSSEGEINDNSDCQGDELRITEREVITPINNSSYFVGFTFKSIQANSEKIQLVAIINDTQMTANIEVGNFVVNLGTQQLNSNPYGEINYLGESYTTFYLPNGQSQYPVDPNGMLTISDINQECNLISGSISIQAYTFSNELGELRFSINYDFENLPLNDEVYQL